MQDRSPCGFFFVSVEIMYISLLYYMAGEDPDLKTEPLRLIFLFLDKHEP